MHDRQALSTNVWSKFKGPSGWCPEAGNAPLAPVLGHLPAPPPQSCWDWDEGEIEDLGKALGEEGFSELSIPPGSGKWPLWERVRKAVLTPLCDLCWKALGGPGWPVLPEQEGPTKLHGPQDLSFGLTSLTAYSYYISVCSSAFWLGSHRNSAFIF